jgi:Cu-Zn family superoxide dismutase
VARGLHIAGGMMQRIVIRGCAGLVAGLALACQEPLEEPSEGPGGGPVPEKEAEPEKTAPSEAEGGTDEALTRVEVDIQGKSGSDLGGTAVLTDVPGGVQVTAELENAPPGEHGFHVHQKADCSAPDATSAGGHFAPRGNPHGLPSDDEHHLGDLGNIEVGKDGTGSKTILAENANLKPGDEHSFLGRALMVHAKPDDGGQPTGNAGARIGCGKITAEGS